MSDALRVSVVIATYGRPSSVCRLVRQLSDQSLPARDYEVVVVDDGSPEPVATRLNDMDAPMRLVVASGPNAGPAAARDVGARLARGAILVILDDDMQVGHRFLEGHLVHHVAGEPVAVLGRMRPDPAIRRMPLFERFHAAQLDRMAAAFRDGKDRPGGRHLYTGNVSMRRADYLGVGGFDRTLKRSEDRELGLRLEAAGVRFVFAEGDADSVHSSDHASPAVWLERARLYGVHEQRIGTKHPGVDDADPWRFVAEVHPAVRPLHALSALCPPLGRGAAAGVLAAAGRLDGLGMARAAIGATTLAYGTAYFAGVGEAGPGPRAVAAGLGRWLAPIRMDRWLEAIRADHACLARYRARHAGEAVSSEELGRHLVEKIGLQMLAGIRLMHLFAATGRGGPAKIVSRTLRHLYGADIHWEAKIAPGVMIVHGMGIAIAGGTHVGTGCVLSQNVTLGEGIDPTSRRTGAPRLEEDVHVGPGATILGPVVVGAGSKIMAGSVLCRSVPPGSLVTPSQVSVAPRRSRSAPARTNGEALAATTGRIFEVAPSGGQEVRRP